MVSDSEHADNYITLMSIVALWPSLAIQAKRWHDRDKSAWWLLMNFLPIIGPIWILVENGFLAGTDGENRYATTTNSVAIEATNET